MKYDISTKAYIGAVFIDCKSVKIAAGVRIEKKNHIACNKLEVGTNASIHSGNIIMGPGNFYIGANARIMNNHYFDLYNNISIGDYSWIAGRGSQFWTHGSTSTKIGNKPLDIKVGSNVYIGSAVLFAPGVEIPSITLIGVGSVVSGKFELSNTIIAGNPATTIKFDIDWRKSW